MWDLRKAQCREGPPIPLVPPTPGSASCSCPQSLLCTLKFSTRAGGAPFVCGCCSQLGSRRLLLGGQEVAYETGWSNLRHQLQHGSFHHVVAGPSSSTRTPVQESAVCTRSLDGSIRIADQSAEQTAEVARTGIRRTGSRPLSVGADCLGLGQVLHWMDDFSVLEAQFDDPPDVQSAPSRITGGRQLVRRLFEREGSSYVLRLYTPFIVFRAFGKSGKSSPNACGQFAAAIGRVVSSVSNVGEIHCEIYMDESRATGHAPFTVGRTAVHRRLVCVTHVNVR